MKTMKAIVYTQYGPAEVLHVKERERPKVKDSEILIKVQAAEATKADCELRSFNFPVKWFALPIRLIWGITKPRRQILGGYFSGVVDAVGSKVTKYQPGDEIFGASRMRMSAYAQYLSLPETYTMVPKPVNISHAETAAVPLGGLNALHFLRKAEIKKGDRVLINGAGGSIGIFAVQIAKAFGAQVHAVDSAHKKDMLTSIGADHFIDYQKDDFTKSGQVWDVVFDMVASSSLESCLTVVAEGGRYLSGNPTFKKMTSGKRVFKKTGKKVICDFAGESEEELLTVKTMIENGKLTPVVDGVFSMEEAAEAHRRVETEQRVGSVVISMVETA